MRGKPHDAEVKAAIIAALLSGEGVAETARQYKLPVRTIARIKAEMSEELAEVGMEKRLQIDELLLDTMRANLSALTRIAEVSSKSEYIEKQPSESIAVLYREIASVTVRLLEAASAAGVGEPRDAS